MHRRSKDMEHRVECFLRRTVVLLAVAGLVTSSEAAVPQSGGREFVGACPATSAEYGARKPGPMRVVYICAHPDDADIIGGGLAAKLVSKGAEVTFVSLCNGCYGHHRLSPEETARVRRGESLEAKRRFGLKDYIVFDNKDCTLQASYENLEAVARLVRKIDPDYVITHRTNDYHVDHRATGRLVVDAGYLLGVPHWVPDVPALRNRPVIFFLGDRFTDPRPIRPDVMVDVGPYMDKWCDGLDAQASQFYDWLPWDKGTQKEVPDRSDTAARNAYLIKYWAKAKISNVRRFAAEWKAENPGAALPKYMEVLEVSEYGRAPTPEDLKNIKGE